MTTFTNVHNIDPAIARAISDDVFYGTSDCDATVTSLIRPPQIAYLEEVHAHEISEDVSERLWALLGQSVHAVIGNSDTDGAIAEERLFCEVEGWRIGGKSDLYREGQIVDYKVTSVWSFLLGDKPDWDKQLNFYAHLWRENGFPVERLTIAAILRDWQKRQASDREDYPTIPFLSKDVALWSPEVAAEAMATAVREHKAARAGNPRECRDEERWARPEKFAVMKKGQKRAVKLFEDSDDATTLAENVPGGFVEHRPGEQVRCESYCAVRAWCAQADRLEVPK